MVVKKLAPNIKTMLSGATPACEISTIVISIKGSFIQDVLAKTDYVDWEGLSYSKTLCFSFVDVRLIADPPLSEIVHIRSYPPPHFRPNVFDGWPLT